MNDLHDSLGPRLQHLADDLVPAVDPTGQAAGAKARYRRARRTRIGLAAAAATAAVVIGVPTAIGALSAPPGGAAAAGGGGAPAGTGQDAAPSAKAAAAAAAKSAAASAAEAAELSAAANGATDAQRATVARAQVAEAVARLDTPVELTAPKGLHGCPAGDEALSDGLGMPMSYWQGRLPGGPMGCEWSSDLSPDTEPADRYSVGVGFLTGTTAAQMRAGVASSVATCSVTDLPAVARDAALQRCDNAGTTQWFALVPDTSGKGIWVLSATVGQHWQGPSGPEGLAQVAALAASTW